MTADLEICQTNGIVPLDGLVTATMYALNKNESSTSIIRD